MHLETEESCPFPASDLPEYTPLSLSASYRYGCECVCEELPEEVEDDET